MAMCGVYGIKGKMEISNEIANQNESLPLKKYTTYSLTITTGTFIVKIHQAKKMNIWLTLKFCPTIHER